jgi:DNA-binding MarR family transcriptional regulator
VNDIAKRLHLETNTVTPLLQRMEKAGLIARKRGEKDSRQRIVSLTPQAIAMREKAKEIPNQLTAEIAKYVSLDEMMALIPSLDKLIEGLQQSNK